MNKKKYKKILNVIKGEKLTTSKDFMKKLKKKLNNVDTANMISFEESLEDYHHIIERGRYELN